MASVPSSTTSDITCRVHGEDIVQNRLFLRLSEGTVICAGDIIVFGSQRHDAQTHRQTHNGRNMSSEPLRYSDGIFGVVRALCAVPEGWLLRNFIPRPMATRGDHLGPCPSVCPSLTAAATAPLLNGGIMLMQLPDKQRQCGAQRSDAQKMHHRHRCHHLGFDCWADLDRIGHAGTCHRRRWLDVGATRFSCFVCVFFLFFLLVCSLCIQIVCSVYNEWNKHGAVVSLEWTSFDYDESLQYDYYCILLWKIYLKKRF